MYYNSVVEGKKPYNQSYFKQRVKEIPNDPAYKLHEMALVEVIIPEFGRLPHTRRILDMGCGLGFMTAEFEQLNSAEAVGVDPSSFAISLAKKEHKGVKFYSKSASSFSRDMSTLGEDPFDIAILNMVLHSVDDETALAILKDVNKCLKPGGLIVVVAPTPEWLRKKLWEYAFDQGWDNITGPLWIQEMLATQRVELPHKIHSEKDYKHVIPVYQRSYAHYAHLFSMNNYGIERPVRDYRGRLIEREYLPCIQVADSTSCNYMADKKERIIIKSRAL